MSHSALQSNYANKTKAKAVFFSPHVSKSFCFEPSDLKWNFSYREGSPDGGSVLDGSFHYDKDFLSENSERPIVGDFCVQAKRDSGLAAHITFYVPGSQDKKALLGEFFVKDPNHIVAGFKGRDVRLTGKWDVVHGDRLEDRLRAKYEELEIIADALFYRSGIGQLPSLHLTVDELNWEFFHGVNLRTDRGLEGCLFYNEGFFDRVGLSFIDAEFLVEKEVEDGKRYVLVKFYRPCTWNGELLGEFLVADPESNSNDLLNQRKTGQWKLLPDPDMEALLSRKYRHEQPSDALFYKGGNDPPSKSFRLEIYDKGWEFWENTPTIGHHLGGSLLFNTPIFGDHDTEPIKTTYYIERVRGNPGCYACIMFWTTDEGPCAEVLQVQFALLHSLIDTMLVVPYLRPDNQAGKAGLLNKVLRGERRKQSYTRFDATASKKNGSTEITLSLSNDIAKTECKKDDAIYSDGFDVKGVLSSKTFQNHGDFVRWSKFCATFHKDSTATDLTAFFFPEWSEDMISSQDDLKMGVTWKTK